MTSKTRRQLNRFPACSWDKWPFLCVTLWPQWSALKQMSPPQHLRLWVETLISFDYLTPPDFPCLHGREKNPEKHCIQETVNFTAVAILVWWPVRCKRSGTWPHCHTRRRFSSPEVQQKQTHYELNIDSILSCPYLLGHRLPCVAKPAPVAKPETKINQLWRLNGVFFV